MLQPKAKWTHDVMFENQIRVNQLSADDTTNTPQCPCLTWYWCFWILLSLIFCSSWKKSWVKQKTIMTKNAGITLILTLRGGSGHHSVPCVEMSLIRPSSYDAPRPLTKALILDSLNRGVGRLTCYWADDKDVWGERKLRDCHLWTAACFLNTLCGQVSETYCTVIGRTLFINNKHCFMQIHFHSGGYESV